MKNIATEISLKTIKSKKLKSGTFIQLKPPCLVPVSPAALNSLKVLLLLYSTVKIIFHFSYFDPDHGGFIVLYPHRQVFVLRHKQVPCAAFPSVSMLLTFTFKLFAILRICLSRFCPCVYLSC
jgi:hypothetical protein